MSRRCSIVVFALSLLTAMPLFAETADEVVSRHVEAMGGKQRLDAVKTVKLTGKVKVNGREAPYSLQLKRPSFVRMDTEMQGQKLVQAYDGKNAWMQMAGRTMQMPPQLGAKMGEQADISGPLVDYKAKGHTVELIGKEELKGKPAFHLKLTKKGGEVSDIYLDAASFLEVKSVRKQKGMNGAEIEVVTWMEDYKKVGGISFPQRVEVSGGPQKMEQNFDKIEVDIPIDDAIFKMPADARPMPSRPSRR